MSEQETLYGDIFFDFIEDQVEEWGQADDFPYAFFNNKTEYFSEKSVTAYREMLRTLVMDAVVNASLMVNRDYGIGITDEYFPKFVDTAVTMQLRGFGLGHFYAEGSNILKADVLQELVEEIRDELNLADLLDEQLDKEE